MDPRIRIHPKISWIRNTDFKIIKAFADQVISSHFKIIKAFADQVLSSNFLTGLFCGFTFLNADPDPKVGQDPDHGFTSYFVLL
jgi:hypothetical protein